MRVQAARGPFWALVNRNMWLFIRIFRFMWLGLAYETILA